ncbi:MAG TPA: serine hydrolase domain-containing protein [Candidatus Sulfotelmatobacter sp.]|nr:serine hydrolase domain-containing protein [Candidatus Sulfotelmatobacter sp.]
MERWLGAALDYIPRWLEFQMRLSAQPGVALAIAHNGRIVLEQAHGHADLQRGRALTPRHRFRVASHSKSFTAAGIMRLRERGKLTLDDAIGRYVDGLHPKIAAATIAQLLSHSAGIVRDGADSGYWQDRRPFRNERELRAELAAAPTIEANTRFKYSNHGYGLAGLAIETITGEAYGPWIRREVIAPAGLEETLPDAPLRRGTPFARGHSGAVLLGHRVVFPGDMSTQALAPATGFVSTAADLARFFAQLVPTARGSLLSAASRREMVRRHWRNPHASVEGYYGLGIISGRLGDWDWFGHAGGFLGYITRSVALPEQALSIAVLTNAVDGWAHPWVDGVMHILRCFAANGAPPRRLKAWGGRWWSAWGASDLVPVAGKIFVATPAFANPFMDASEIVLSGRDSGLIKVAGGYANHGEPVRRRRTKSGRTIEVWLGSSKLLPAAALAEEMRSRYAAPVRRRRNRAG